MATKKPAKAEVVNQTKRANNRLKVIGETCLNLAQGRDTRPPERVHKQRTARLNRELTPADVAGTALRDAVEAFWRELHSGADYERQSELASAVYAQVRQVQYDRWRLVEAKHGKVHHYFDAFGQIKPRYRRDSPKTIRDYGKPASKHSRWLLVLILLLIGLFVWWLY